jgi:hypothetical protein
MPGMSMPAASASPSAAPAIPDATMLGASMRDMASTTDLADPMSQEGSGTSWVPRATRMFGWMQMHGADMTMEHGAIFPRYDAAGSQRGSRRLDAPNWFMAMGTHAFGNGAQLGYRAMVSADALTENAAGYPLLFQTGETAHGQALHDRQHPHDLVAELALDASVRLGRAASLYAYVADPGEPALGPPAFMHRRIAYDMPDAPIGHHWMDATHIQFGVATLGIAPSTRFKLEASAFTGREPNEARTNFDPVHLDSTSLRASWNPTASVAAQVSYGFIVSPDATSPATNQHRATASVLYDRTLDDDHELYAALIVGRDIDTDGPATNAYLFETDYEHGGETLFARLEFGTRTAHDLALSGLPPTTVVAIGTLALGAVHDLTRNHAAVDVGIGAQLSVSQKSGALTATYGGYVPIGYQLYFRIRPPVLGRAAADAGMAGMKM